MPFAASRSITGLKRKPRAAVRRAAAGGDFLQNRVSGEVARRNVTAPFGQELALFGVEQPAAQLVAERIPHDRIHSHQPRREVADRKELHELHVDQLGAGAQCQRVAIAAHVERRAVARIQARQSAGRDDGRLRRDRYRRPGGHVYRLRPGADPIANGEIRDQEVADALHLRYALHAGAQGLGDGGTGVEEIDVDAALAVVAGRMHLREMPVAARPADSPLVHFADARGALLAEQLREFRVAQAAAGLEGVGKMVLPVVGLFLAHRDCHGHLRHDGRAAAPDQAAIHQQHPGACARRRNRRVHAGATGPDDQDVSLQHQPPGNVPLGIDST
jgi:hypothetical protein